MPCPIRKKSYSSLFKEGHDLQANFKALLTSLPVVMESQEAGPLNINWEAEDPKGRVNEVLESPREEVGGEESGQQPTPSQEWSEIDVSEVFSGIFEEQKLSAARPLDNSEGQNRLQQDVSMSAVMEVGQVQRRFTEDAEDQERESKCSRVGLSSLPILQDFDPVQDWGKEGEEEGDIEGEFWMEGGKGRGEKVGRVGDNENVVLEENQGREGRG